MLESFESGKLIYANNSFVQFLFPYLSSEEDFFQAFPDIILKSMMCVVDHKLQSACDEKTKLGVPPTVRVVPLLFYTTVISCKSFL